MIIMKINPTVMEHFTRVGAVLIKIMLILLIAFNIIVLLPGIYFAAVLGNWTAPVVVIGISLAVWFGGWQALRALRRWIIRKHIRRPKPRMCAWHGYGSTVPAVVLVTIGRPCGHRNPSPAPTCLKHLAWLHANRSKARVALPCPECGVIAPADVVATADLPLVPA